MTNTAVGRNSNRAGLKQRNSNHLIGDKENKTFIARANDIIGIARGLYLPVSPIKWRQRYFFRCLHSPTVGFLDKASGTVLLGRLRRNNIST